jgi:triacylglycerol esterase/lipase EstA (alpha/beta hydrolase family)
MSHIAKLSLPTIAFLTSALCLGMGYMYTAEYPAMVVSGIFSWMCGIQILNSAAPKFPRPVCRLIHWTHAMTFEGFALLGVALLRFLPKREKTTPGNGRPILLVHGYINHGSAWAFQKQHLRKAGFGPIYAINLGYPFRSIRTFAEKVKKKAEEIAKETSRNDLILIGHSMGGLISSWYATKLAPSNTVTDVITIASPFIGTPMARIALGPNAREMEPHSPLLQELKQAIDQHPHIHFCHIATRADQLVIPGDSAIIPHHPHFIMEDVGHASLLYSRRVTNQITTWLKEDRLKNVG